VTRAGVHIDRVGSAWLIRRFIDPDATFGFVTDIADVPDGTIPFDMRGVEFTHYGDDCTFETLLRRHDLLDPVLWRIAAIVHEADLEDDRYDAPEAAGLDVVLRGLSMTVDDDQVIEHGTAIFDGLYAYFHRAVLAGKDPACPTPTAAPTSRTPPSQMPQSSPSRPILRRRRPLPATSSRSVRRSRPGF